MPLPCVAPGATGEQSSESDAAFELAFPKLVESLWIRADVGKVIRAHFPTELRDGMFIVVGGEEAAENAVERRAESLDVIAEATEAAGATDARAPESCRMIPIGPVAVLPMR